MANWTSGHSDEAVPLYARQRPARRPRYPRHCPGASRSFSPRRPWRPVSRRSPWRHERTAARLPRPRGAPRSGLIEGYAVSAIRSLVARLLALFAISITCEAPQTRDAGIHDASATPRRPPATRAPGATRPASMTHAPGATMGRRRMERCPTRRGLAPGRLGYPDTVSPEGPCTTRVRTPCRARGGARGGRARSDHVVYVEDDALSISRRPEDVTLATAGAADRPDGCCS